MGRRARPVENWTETSFSTSGTFDTLERKSLAHLEHDMPKAYVIFSEVIRDPDGMRAYGRAAGPTLASSGASVLAFGPAAEVLEGEWPADQTVILEFESVEAARDWYQSEAYQAAAPLRQAAADTNAVLVTGLPGSAR
jgi:uncharacterized protein (DUF1330 family)